MTSLSRVLSLSLLLRLCVGGALLLPAACSDPQAGTDFRADGTSDVTGSLVDAPLQSSQRDLLDLAFGTATALPVNPHIKTRSRAQEEVVAACLQLDQPLRARACIEKIDNWRAGAACADIAFYCAQHGQPAEAQRDLDRALEISEKARQGEDSQDWQVDRVRVKIARTYLLLGQPEQAARFETGVVDSEAGKVAAVRATLAEPAAFDEQMKAVDAVFAAGNFDQGCNALETCAQLFNRFYADEARRSQVEDKIKASWTKMPVTVRLDLLRELADFALEHADRDKALALAREAQAVMDGFQWTAEDRVPLMARWAALLGRAGSRDEALREAQAALALFDAERSRIVDIYRAGVLRPLAEAYQSMGETAAALDVYKRAVEEGFANFNSRPRAEDLSATCCSMALHGVQPDADLQARMLEIRAKLGSPW